MSAKQQRQGTRMCVKREIDKISPMLKGTAAVNLPQLEVSIAKLSSYKSDLVVADSKVLSEAKDPTVAETEIQDAARFNDEVLEIIAQANVMAKHAAQTSQTSSGDSHGGPSARGAPIRLPKLEIPHFTGDPLDFQGFWDAFDSSVNNNSNLSVIDKFNYLKGLLTGDALKAIEGYRLTAANYDDVVATLKDRFGNKQLAVFGHFEAMLALPQASYETLQSVCDACERHIRSLVALDLDESTFGQVFTPIMLSKLPRAVKIELHRKNGSQVWSLSNLREWLKDEIRARELAERSFGEQTSSSKHDTSDFKQQSKAVNGSTAKPPQGQAKKPSSTSALVSNAASKIVCSFCGQGHYSDQCSKFATVAQRREKLSDHCYSCLKEGHRTKACKRGPEETGLNVETQTTHDGDVTPSKRTILQTAVAEIVNPINASTVEARLLFDTAGSRSFITENKRMELELDYVGEELVSVAGFRSAKRKTSRFKLVEFDIVCRDGSKQRVSASVVPSITCPIQKVPLDTESCEMLQHVTLSEPLVQQPEFVGIDILIGLDYYYNIVGSHQIRCPGGPLLLSSRLGYIATGRVATNTTGPETIAVMLLSGGATKLETLGSLERYWDLEDIGVRELPTERSGDEEALAEHSLTLQRDADGRYQSRWPWKSSHPDLPDNFDLAHGRLKSQLKKLNRNADILQSYNQTIEDQLKKGVIEVAPEAKDDIPVYYMPHHCVLTPSKTTTKLRVVYDASSKSAKEAPSLNDCLHRGPVMLGDLCGLLLRFRLFNVALVSDIEKAFLQVGLQNIDRDVTRFLWVRNPKLPAEGDNLVIYRFCRVPFGVISSPFVLANTVRQHLIRVNTAVSANILDNHYVDNVVTGENDVEDAKNHYCEAKLIFQSACMNLREWFTNSEEVRAVIPEKDRGTEKEPKVLGLRWNTERDTLRCTTGSSDGSIPTTKRMILTEIAKIFDPLGFFAPVTVLGKMLVQDLWRLGCGWDDKIPPEFVKRWSKLKSSFEAISVSEIPRFVGSRSPNDISMELHVFCDASIKASAAAVYLRKSTPSCSSCDLLFAKTRLAPVKNMQTIPRLELIAVLMGVRILAFVLSELKCTITARYVWTDSQCTLHWINKERVATRFVENRLAEIRKHDGVTFGYVPTKDNPADLPSRGAETKEVVNSQLWFHGPRWLCADRSTWPIFLPSTECSVGDEVVTVSVIPSISLSETSDRGGFSNIIDGTKFSKMSKLHRCTAYVFRFIRNAKSGSDKLLGTLRASEIQQASKYWIIAVQKEAYPELWKHDGSTWPKGIAQQLNLFRDESNVLRCAGRISESDLAYETKYPVLLPANHWYTGLLIQDCHEKLLHAGVTQTLAQSRRKFWIVRGRSTVRRVLRSCRRCRRVEGGPYRLPPIPGLPKSRVSSEPPFSFTGVDYLGPIFAKSSDNNAQKTWICLFTCMSIRAIHLEVVIDLSAHQFLLALRRFIALFGTPRYILSDNATNFHASKKAIDKLWQDVLQDSSIHEFASNHSIQWEFVVQFAPWMGGFYERLIGTVKRALKKALDGICVTLPELVTVVAETTAVVNARPLTYVEEEVGVVPITPRDLLSGESNRPLPNIMVEEAEFAPRNLVAQDLILKWKRLRAITDKFWDMWRHEYLTSLRERACAHNQRNTSDIKPRIGSVVQIKDNKPRAQWKLATIQQLQVSKDGQARSALLRLPNGRTTKRPLKLLYPLEVGDDLNDVESGFVHGDSKLADTSGPRLQQRLAAKTARERWKSQLNDREDDSKSD